jgi:tetratricopeptide (TPR) repeat protein
MGEPMIATRLFSQSQELSRAGRFGAALEALEEALREEPASAWGWAHHGDLLYQHVGRYAEALASFDRAVALRPGYAWALAHRGATYERLNRFPEAKADLDQALAVQPKYMWAVAMLARVFQMTGQFERAFECVEAVSMEAPQLLPHWREERAMMRMLLRRHADAQAHFEAALQADPDDRFAHYNGAVNLVCWRGVEAARPALQQLRARLEQQISSSPNSRDVDRSIYELGGLAALEGNEPIAIERLEEARRRELGLVLLSPAVKRARVDMAWDGLRDGARFRALVYGAALPA